MSEARAKLYINTGVVTAKSDIYNVLRPLLKQTVSYTYYRGRKVTSRGTGANKSAREKSGASTAQSARAASSARSTPVLPGALAADRNGRRAVGCARIESGLGFCGCAEWHACD